MSSTQFWKDSDEAPLPQGLANILAEVTEIDQKLSEIEVELKRMKARRTRLEEIAVEEMTAGGLDGVKVSGRSWRVEDSHHLSVAMDRRDEVLEAARGMGLDVDVLTQVNTARLKALLKEKATEAGKESGRPLSSGTPLEGVVSEYVVSRLRHRAS